MATPINICWFRRDLRLEDNAALFHALKSGLPVLPVFIFDSGILDQLEDPADRRVEFIHMALQKMQQQLQQYGSGIKVLYGKPAALLPGLLEKYNARSVFVNHDYEPYGVERDYKIKELLEDQQVDFYSFKDQVIFERNEIIKENGSPYTVFTPYSRKWKAALTDFQLKAYPTGNYFESFFKCSTVIPSLESIGFKATGQVFTGPELDEDLVVQYQRQRDYPGLEGTSKLGVHLRFGTVSIRSVAQRARTLSETFLNELIWRDFYQMILWHFPRVGKGQSFKPAYDNIEWRADQGEFEKWCSGQTGFPIVDAGMRELNSTGFMHNRVRMITASFLCKHLLLDWRLGEAWFAGKLLDFDLAANNGGWQWAAGSGCDAAPYFRIFNPYLQTKKFDPGFSYIKKWVPEFQEFDYPAPIVDHDMARKRCLEVYSKALKRDSL